MQATILRERGDLEAAATILADIAPDAAALPYDSFAVLAHKRGCAHVALLRGQFDEAAAAIEPAVRLFEERDMRVGVLVFALRLRSEIRYAQGNLAMALADARNALAIAEELRGGNPCSSMTGSCSLLLARLEHAAGHAQEADAALRNAIAHLKGALGDDHPETRLALALVESMSSATAPNVSP
jgi:ATP/maltotriose-dependent transcriptional regulator MalT